MSAAHDHAHDEQRTRAQAFVDRGWFPFPVEYGGKRPGVGIKWGTATATAPTAKMLDLWFCRDRMNIGIAARPSRLVILDADRDGAMEALCAAYGQEVPRTYRVRTAKGWHYYFDAPQHVEIGNSPGPLKEFGFDVRGGRGGSKEAGGYVVAAGSMHATGHVYAAEDDDADTVELPWWITELLTAPSTPDVDGAVASSQVGEGSGLLDPPRRERRQFTVEEAQEFVRPAIEALAAAGKGEINPALNIAARTVAHFGPEFWTRAEAERRLMQLQLRPWHDADESGARATIASAYAAQAIDEVNGGFDREGRALGWRAELVERGDPFGGAEEVGEDGLTAVERVYEAAVDAELRKLKVREEASRRLRKEKAAERPSIAEGVIDDLDAIEPPTMLMRELIPELGVGFLGGRSGAYKSFLAVAWACCIGTGTPWLGRVEFAVRRKLKVLYVAAEGAAGAAARMKAWEAHPGLSRRGRVLLYPRPIQLNDEDRAEELGRYVVEHGIEFLVVDTFRRSTSNGDDNSTTEMGVVFDAVARIRDDHGCGALFIDHTGHAGERLRGASVKGDDADYVLIASYEGQVRGPDVPRSLTVQKLKDLESGQTWPVGLTHVPDHFPVATIRDSEMDEAVRNFGGRSEWWEGAPSVPEPTVAALDMAAGKARRGVTAAQWIWKLLNALDTGEGNEQGLTLPSIRRMLNEIPGQEYSEATIRNAAKLLVDTKEAVREKDRIRLESD